MTVMTRRCEEVVLASSLIVEGSRVDDFDDCENFSGTIIKRFNKRRDKTDEICVFGHESTGNFVSFNDVHTKNVSRFQ